MANSHSITITNINGKKYRFFQGEVSQARYGIITKLFKAPLPDDDGESQIVINLGKEKLISGDFKFLDTPGQDASVGTDSSIETISDKLDYINDVFLTSGINDLYTIDLETHTGSILGKTGVVENFNFTFTGTNMNSLTGNFSFNIGGGNVQ